MAGHDKSSVEFGMSLLSQQQDMFREERKRKEKQDRKFALAKLVTSGLSNVVKNKFNAFEQNEMYKKIKLNDIYNKSQDILNTQGIIDEQYDGDANAYFKNFYKTQFNTIATDMYPNYDPALLKQYYVKKAEDYARTKAADWNEIVSEARGVPRNIEQLDAQWDRYVQSQVPNNVFGWATRGLKNLLSGASKQEVEQGGKKERDKFLQSSYFKEYGELENAYNNREQISPTTVREDFETIFENIDEQTRKNLQKPVQVNVSQPYISGGKEKQDLTLIFRDVNSPGGYRVENVNVLSRPAPLALPKDSELQLLRDRSDRLYAGADKKDYEALAYFKDGDSKNADTGFFTDIYLEREALRRSEAYQLIANENEVIKLLIDRKIAGISGPVTSYDILDKKITEAIEGGDPDKAVISFNQLLQNIKPIYEEITEQTKDENILRGLYTRILNNINNVLSGDRRVEQIQVLNEVFKYDINENINIDNNSNNDVVPNYIAPDGTQFFNKKIIYRRPAGGT